MESRKIIKEIRPPYLVNQETPEEAVFLQDKGQTVAVMISVSEYERYQVLLHASATINASEARRLANRVVFGDLVGLALSVGDPIWVQAPKPAWRIPYRLFDGTLIQVIDVDTQTGQVLLSRQERDNMLTKVSAWIQNNDGKSH